MYFQFLLFIAPALIMAIVAQVLVKTAYARSRRQPASMSGFAAARHVLDEAGLREIGIQQTPGHLSDHYDPRQKVLRLSGEVYHGRSMAAVGIAAHEAGHALQDAQGYLPMMIRNAAVGAANFGSSASWVLLLLGVVLRFPPLIQLGILLFGSVVFFQLVNLPVELNASARAKSQLVELGIVERQEIKSVSRVLNAAALTYVAATIQSMMTLLYYLWRFTGRRQ